VEERFAPQRLQQQTLNSVLPHNKQAPNNSPSQTAASNNRLPTVYLPATIITLTKDQTTLKKFRL